VFPTSGYQGCCRDIVLPRIKRKLMRNRSLFIRLFSTDMCFVAPRRKGPPSPQSRGSWFSCALRFFASRRETITFRSAASRWKPPESSPIARLTGTVAAITSGTRTQRIRTSSVCLPAERWMPPLTPNQPFESERAVYPLLEEPAGITAVKPPACTVTDSVRCGCRCCRPRA
jgi:hypothetical protein